MGYTDNQKEFSQISAFGEQLVAEYTPTVEWSFGYPYPAGYNIILQTPTTANGGTVTIDTDTSSAMVSTGTNAAGSSTLRSNAALRYKPGIGGRMRFTAIYTQGVADSVQFCGLTDFGIDELGFGYNGATFGVWHRLFGEASFIPDTSFTHCANYQAMKHDPTKLNVYQIQFQWLGGGELRFFIEDENIGGFVLVHVIRYANKFTRPSLREGTLFIGMYATNDGNTSNITVRSPSASAGLEGQDINTTNIGYFSAPAQKLVSTETPILSLRNDSTFNGVQNRIFISPKILSLASLGNQAIIFRVYQQATLTGAVWTPVADTVTPGSYDISATARTGGIPAGAFVVSANDSSQIYLDRLKIRFSPGAIFTLTAQSNNTSVSTSALVGIFFGTEF